jgi:NADH:ubiquinone oxidoreductase subunit E
METAVVDQIIERHHSKESALIAMLQDVQEEFTYLPAEVLVQLSSSLGVPLSRTYSIATFYKAFSLEPRGEHPVAICMGTACHVKGGVKILEKFERRLGIKSGETTEDLKFGLEEVHCLGCCGLAPVVTVGNDLYGKVTLPRVDGIISKCKKDGKHGKA